MNNKVNNVIRIPCSLDKLFFKHWMTFLLPFHHLTKRQIDVVASFLKTRYELSKVITDENLLDKILMNDDTKKQIRDECGMTL